MALEKLKWWERALNFGSFGIGISKHHRRPTLEGLKEKLRELDANNESLLCSFCLFETEFIWNEKSRKETDWLLYLIDTFLSAVVVMHNSRKADSVSWTLGSSSFEYLVRNGIAGMKADDMDLSSPNCENKTLVIVSSSPLDFEQSLKGDRIRRHIPSLFPHPSHSSLPQQLAAIIALNSSDVVDGINEALSVETVSIDSLGKAGLLGRIAKTQFIHLALPISCDVCASERERGHLYTSTKDESCRREGRRETTDYSKSLMDFADYFRAVSCWTPVKRKEKS